MNTARKNLPQKVNTALKNLPQNEMTKSMCPPHCLTYTNTILGSDQWCWLPFAPHDVHAHTSCARVIIVLGAKLGAAWQSSCYLALTNRPQNQSYIPPLCCFATSLPATFHLCRASLDMLCDCNVMQSTASQTAYHGRHMLDWSQLCLSKINTTAHA